MDIRLLLRELRFRKELTQTKLAKLAGISKVSVCRLETGKDLPTMGTLMKLAKGTGTELKIMFEEKKDA